MLRRSKSNRDIFDTKTGGRAGNGGGSSKEAGQPALTRQPSSSILIGGGAPAVVGTGESRGPAASTDHFFSGLVIHLVRRGIGRVQYDVLCQRIQEKGGTVSAGFGPNVAVVVVASKLTHGDLLRHLNLTELPDHCRAHTLEWLTESLRWKRCLTAKEYALVPASIKAHAPPSSPPVAPPGIRPSAQAVTSPAKAQERVGFTAPSAAFLAALHSKTDIRLGTRKARCSTTSPPASKLKGSPEGEAKSAFATVTPSFEWCPGDGDGSGEEDDNNADDSKDDRSIARYSSEGKKASESEEDDSEGTEVDEELQNYLKRGAKRRRIVTSEASKESSEGAGTSSARPRPKRQRSKQKFNVFKLENDWLKYDSSENEDEEDEMKANKFSVFLADSSLSLSLSPSSAPGSPTRRTASESAALADPTRSPEPMAPHEDEEERRMTEDEEESDTEYTKQRSLSEREGKTADRTSWMKRDPLFNPLFGRAGSSDTRQRRPDCRTHLLEAASVSLGHKMQAEETAPMLVPITSSSSLSPYRESPEREIYEEFSQIYDIDGQTHSREQDETSPKKETCSQGEEEEEDFSQHLTLPWDPTSPAKKRKSTEASTEESPSQFSIEEFSPRHKRMSKGKQFWACQQSLGQSPAKTNHNQAITDILEVMQKKSDAAGDKWRSFAYRKAVAALKAHHREIKSEAEALKVRGVGKSIAAKIGEIIATGRLRKADATDEQAEVMALFSKIWGAGPETVKKWYAQGLRTLDDLQHAKLTRPQQVGLRHYYDFQKRILREEVRLLEKVVKKEAKAISPHLKAVTCGSYRRGKADCGDVDILITHKLAAPLDGVLEKLLNALHARGFLTDDLVRSQKKGDVYMGVCCLPSAAGGSGIHRRIDIRMIPRESWACALLYFTGSDHFNRSMRLWARRNGLSLSEKDLRPRYTEEIKGEPIPGLLTEEDVFKALGLDYKHPHERDV